jgi:sodium/potassium-transporting ATPase subunit beta
MLAVFWTTLDVQQPKWKLDNGLIGANPGLGFRPMPPESNVESTLVWFEASNDKNTEYWVGALDEFLECEFHTKVSCFIVIKHFFCFHFFSAYTDKTNKAHEKNRVDCSFDKPPINGQVCRVDVSPNKFGGCTTENKYGYMKGSPCVFLKLNKVKKKKNFGESKTKNKINKFFRFTIGNHNSTTVPVICQT